MQTARASVFSTWGAWDLTGEVGEEMLIAWISVPAWGDLTGEAGEQHWLPGHQHDALRSYLPGGYLLRETVLNQVIFPCF